MCFAEHASYQYNTHKGISNIGRVPPRDNIFAANADKLRSRDPTTFKTV